VSLTSAERRALRARAHHLQPVVTIGNAGLTPEVTREIDVNLKSHELIKIRVLGEGRAERKDLIEAICTATAAEPVQHIGKILVIYRQQPPEEAQKGAHRPRRKAVKRTKRSYQNRRLKE
jgi:putative YhbY family RNA-binding protein